MNINVINNKKLIFLMYIFMFVFIICKVNFYSDNVGRFPDEQAQISYVAYLEKTGDIIPEFKKMTLLIQKQENEFQFSEDEINYLGHPPLYYQIMRLSGGIEIIDDIIKVDINTLRNFSQLIAYAGIILAFSLGYRILDSFPLHLIYSAMIVSVPMLTYSMAGVNNDTLAFLGMNITMIGLDKYRNKKYNLLTYLIISSGIFITMMSKLTAGMILVIVGILFITKEYMQKQSLKFIINKDLLLTLPLYLLVMIYYLFILINYKTIHPSLKTIAPEYFKTTGFYVKSEMRSIMSFMEYMAYYWKSFFKTWIGILSHVSLVKSGSFINIESIGIFSVWILPVMSFFGIKTTKFKDIFIYVYIGVLFTSLYQFIRAYKNFLSNGYMGSFQSRYYLCALPAMAMLICLWLKDRYELIKNELVVQTKDTKVIEICFFIICLAYVGLLIYDDIIYFLINFNNYI